MILYYCSQFKRDGVWHNDITCLPLAIKREQAHLLIETMESNDDERLIRIEKFEAMNNCHGRIYWVTSNIDRQWFGRIVSVDEDLEPYLPEGDHNG